MTCIKRKYEWCWLCRDKYYAGYFNVCEAKELMETVPSGLIVAKFYFSPLLLVFLPIVLAVVAVYKTLENPETSYRMRKLLQKRWLSYILAVLIGIIIAPLFFGLAPTLLSIFICINICKRCKSDVCTIIFGIVEGLIGTPFVIVAVVFISIVAHCIGNVLLIYKLFVYLRRCKDPSYLRPKMKYGYF